MTNNDDLLAFFTGSALRREILFLLRKADTPVTNTTLSERSSGTRTTVHYAIEHLLENRWVQKTTGQNIDISVAGHLVLRAYETFCDRESESVFLILTRAPVRAQILRYLNTETNGQEQRDDNQYYQSAEIAKNVAGSRSTVSRGLSQCADQGWIAKGTAAQYAVTPAGERVIRAYDTLENIVSWVTTNASCLNQFGSIELGANLPLDVLNGDITAIEAERVNPDAPFLHYKEQLIATQPTILRGMLPVVSLQADVTRQLLSDANTSIELIIDDEVVAAAQESYPSQFAAIRDDKRITLLRYPSQLQVGIALFNEMAVLGSYDDKNGHFHAMLSSSSDSFTEYVTTIYRERYHRSHHLQENKGLS